MRHLLVGQLRSAVDILTVTGIARDEALVAVAQLGPGDGWGEALVQRLAVTFAARALASVSKSAFAAVPMRV